MVRSRQPCRSRETFTRTNKPWIRVDDLAREEGNRDEAEGGVAAPARRKIPKSRPPAEPDDEGVDAPSIPRAPWLRPARR